MALGSILWLLAIGALFYFMMRSGGCGGHNHGGHGQGGHTKEGWTVRDPVCGAEGPADKAPVNEVHESKVYHFCSTKCRDLFLANPGRYIGSADQPAEHHQHTM